MLGYFPSYALGSAYGAQMLARMEEDFDVFAAVKEGRIDRITAWLGEKIHRWGSLKDPGWLVENACGGPFDPKYYLDYLEKKYTDLYGLT